MLNRSNNAVNDPNFDPPEHMAPVSVDDTHIPQVGWTAWLVIFSRVVAGLTVLKGLYHWAAICGFGAGPDGGFLAQQLAWQIATVFFAIIDLVAAVGLWLAAPWGILIWLASAVTMIAVHAFLPQIYGSQPLVIMAEVAVICAYGYIAYQASHERRH